jgi:4-hydroxythreonine-4-phosphate dehydrogenase
MKPLAFTMGDPAGIGPELLLKAFLRRPAGAAPWFVVADPQVLAWTAHVLDLPLAPVEIDTPEAAQSLPPGTVAVLPTLTGADTDHLVFGRSHPGHAAATVESIRVACRMALAGRVAAVVTPPINKAVLHAGGFDIPGHTELLASCAGASHPVMMLAGKGLRVVPATIHQSLRSVSESLTHDHLQRVIETTWRALRVDFSLERPRIRVAGLNPHAGENGAFGLEEQRIIEPVCRALAAQHEGDISGPYPADTLFHAAARAQYDAVVCMYHDQALIPLKMLAFGEAVNITLGLPIVRTSVDHGTAYDIAGRNVADPGSLLAAAHLAEIIARNRHHVPKEQAGDVVP